jgi:fatty aldehyde-generating acyl-ACP reductase
MIPHLTQEAPWFTFVGHPRTIRDLYEIKATALLREYSLTEEEFVARACTMEPVVAGTYNFGSSAIWGELVVVMRMYPDIMGKAGRDWVGEAVRVAAHRGARIVGLGALTSPATGGGLTLLSKLSSGMVVTTGNAYTAVVAAKNVDEAMHRLGSRGGRVAIVGCTGSVGVPASQLLYERGYDLVLVGRSQERVRLFLSALQPRAVFADSLEAVRDADVILLLTNEPLARLRPENVKPGAIVLDLAQPFNVDRGDWKAFAERGVSVVEGGVVKIHGYRSTYDFDLRGDNSCFACFAETYLFAREGLREHSVGRARLGLCAELERVAGKHGVEPVALASCAHVWVH